MLTPGFGIDEEQAQLGDPISGVYDHDRSNPMAGLLSDPKAFPLGIMVANEFYQDFCDQSFEGFIKLIFFCVDDAVPMDDPTDIAGPVGSASMVCMAFNSR